MENLENNIYIYLMINKSLGKTLCIIKTKL